MTSPARQFVTGEATGSTPSLAIVRGPLRGTIFPLVLEQTLVGRLDSNHIAIDDASVSRIHARLERTVDGVVIEDLQSRAGTFVNGARLTERRTLADGDELVVGTVAFVFATPSGG